VGLSKKFKNMIFPQERSLSCAHSGRRSMRWSGGSILRVALLPDGRI
jgi:hypothetical protein